ncbi:MAG: FAD-binding protein [Pirellulaceae bacterium]|nr:FAD-binding protein [Pirellulaceae bacterium]
MNTSDLHPSPDAVAALERELRAGLRGEVHFDRMSCGLHATDASHYQMIPACVAAPRDEADCITAVAAAGRNGVPITPRGGGTSLSGQTFGPGLVLDVSKYMDQVLEVNVGQRWARVQPGVIRDLLNAHLAPQRLHFAPDPATGNRATIGGMIGNNASGTRSIVYGKTIDHVISCRVVLADGTVMDLEPVEDDQWRRCSEGGTRAAEIYRGVSAIIAANRDEILARYPKVMRRVSGYNLDEFVDGAGYTGPIGGRNLDGHRAWNLANLIVGSEGTLACVLEAKLRLTPLPAATALAIVQFDDELASLRHVPEILAHPVSTVELLDELVIRESLVNPTTRRLATFFEGQPKAVLIVEVFGSDAADAQRRIHDVVADLKSKRIGYAWPVRTDKQGQADVWSVRKLGLGLISNVPGPVKGQAFVEDACVPVEVLAEYIERLQAICRELDVPTTMYAHASVGVIHFRPRLDLHLPEHRGKMVEIANRAFELVCQYGGVFAGEHGDGLVRGEFIPRYYGPRLYEAFRQIKGLFDPGNVMNPGKIVDTPSMTSHLRYGDGYQPKNVPTLFHYREQDGFQRAVEQCNGVGACRKLDAGTMCPSFMATRDEEASTRGRANALRLAMSGQLGDDALGSDRMKQVLDLCLACKACKGECPNAVDMARLKSEVLQMHHDRHGVPLGYRLIGDMPQMARWLAGPLAHVVNLVARLPGYGWLLEKIAGIDRRRAMPPFATRTLAQLLRTRDGGRKATLGTGDGSGDPSGGPRPRVVLFDDTYANYLEPQVGLSAVELLESCGYEVVLARAGCCQRPRLSKGLVRQAKRDGTKTMQKLDVYARQGLPILCLEPSCASALADDLPDLLDDAELGRRVAACVTMIDVFLDREVSAGRLAPLTATASKFLLHGHCHQKAEFGTAAIRGHFARLPNVACEEVDSGCCGMAGSFGYEHFDVSLAVGQRRLFPAVQQAVAEGKTVIACGISCRHQLRDALGVEAKHWVEVVRAGDAAEG